MTELLFKEEVYAIVGAAMEVYNQLGLGFLEAVYQEALEIELHDHRGQLHNYLKATNLELGLLFNFGSHDRLEWERWVRSHQFMQIGVDSRKKNA